ncbi:MAG: MMPL family transporter [Deltaproteobacteria bacterium]|nr:MMPL family transporter [Deltaproteobacteria bacterium]
MPNLVPMACTLGAMVLLDIDLRIGTSVICAVALGIAVDDTLHLVTAFRRAEENRKGASLEQVLNSVFRLHAKALVITSLALVGGFVGLSFAELNVMRDMGVLGAASLSLAFFADVIWLPALWILVKRRAELSCQSPS